MQSWVWYLGLTIAGIIITGFTLVKKRNQKLFPFYFFLSVIIVYFEFVIFVIFESYTYFPGVVKDPYFDSVIGAVVSDFFIVPSVAFAIAAFQLNFPFILLVAFILMGIENAFVKLNIYEQHWWKTIYTGIGLLIHFKIAKLFWKSLLGKSPKLYIRLIALYTSYHSIHGISTLFASIIFSLLSFEVGWMTNSSREHIFFHILYHIVIGWIAAITIGLNMKWYYRIIGIMSMYALDWILLKANLLHFSSHFSINEFFIFHLIILTIIIKFNLILINKPVSND